MSGLVLEQSRESDLDRQCDNRSRSLRVTVCTNTGCRGVSSAPTVRGTAVPHHTDATDAATARQGAARCCKVLPTQVQASYTGHGTWLHAPRSRRRTAATHPCSNSPNLLAPQGSASLQRRRRRHGTRGKKTAKRQHQHTAWRSPYQPCWRNCPIFVVAHTAWRSQHGRPLERRLHFTARSSYPSSRRHHSIHLSTTQPAGQAGRQHGCVRTTKRHYLRVTSITVFLLSHLHRVPFSHLPARRCFIKVRPPHLTPQCMARRAPWRLREPPSFIRISCYEAQATPVRIRRSRGCPRFQHKRRGTPQHSASGAPLGSPQRKRSLGARGGRHRRGQQPLAGAQEAARRHGRATLHKLRSCPQQLPVASCATSCSGSQLRAEPSGARSGQRAITASGADGGERRLEV